MTFTRVRPFPDQVSEILVGTGNIPITNKACAYLAIDQDAEDIFQLILKAASAAQGTNNLGIPNPAPELNMTAGLAENDLRDLIAGETQIAYNEADAPRAYVVRGTVIIPNQEAPNGPPLATLTIEQYIGLLVVTSPSSPGALQMNPKTGEFTWI
jgi:hypothetical protein